MTNKLVQKALTFANITRVGLGDEEDPIMSSIVRSTKEELEVSCGEMFDTGPRSKLSGWSRRISRGNSDGDSKWIWQNTKSLRISPSTALIAVFIMLMLALHRGIRLWNYSRKQVNEQIKPLGLWNIFGGKSGMILRKSHTISATPYLRDCSGFSPNSFSLFVSMS